MIVERRPVAAIAGAALVGIVLRLHFLAVPLTTDEGGYAAIARLWSHGNRLYGDVAWVDRPQGLALLYRLAGLADGTTGVRLLAISAATITLVAVAAAAWALAGSRAAIVAASLYAVASPAPHLEGFTANGELLAGAFATTGVALVLRWRRRPSALLLVAAGLAAGAAPMVKQSAFDGAVVVVVVLLATPRVHRPLALTIAALATPGLVALAHGLLTGPADWWYAVVGYHTATESVVRGDHGAQLRAFLHSLGPLRDLYALLAVATFAGLAARRRLPTVIIAAWLAAVLVGVAGGGLFHPHYWIALIAPGVVIAAVGITSLTRPALRLALAVAGAGTIVAPLGAYTTTSPRQVSQRTSADTRILDAPAVGRALEQASRSGDRVLALWANASVYWYTDRVPASRYLWHRNLELIPGAVPTIVAEVTGPTPPAAIAVYQPPRSLDRTGAIERAIATRYTLVATIAGVPVYRLRR